MTAETGSYRWMAPEVIRHEPYGTGCDVYSFGVLCWEMLTYSIPFPQHTVFEVALSVATKGMRPEIPAHSPRVLVDLIEQCWQQQALLRPSFAKVRRAPRRSRSRALTPVLALAALLAPTPPRPRRCLSRAPPAIAGVQSNRRHRGRDGVARAARRGGGLDWREAGGRLRLLGRDAARDGLRGRGRLTGLAALEPHLGPRLARREAEVLRGAG